MRIPITGEQAMNDPFKIAIAGVIIVAAIAMAAQYIF